MVDLFYMHPSDNLVITLVTSLLNNTNFHSWSKSIHVALHFKTKLGFINRILILPNSSDPKSITWDR